MNYEVREKWVRALRSGEYPQTKRALHNNYGFCCLGVLCDLAVKEGILTSEYDNETITYYYGKSKESCFLPFEVMDWAELETSDGVSWQEIKGCAVKSLAILNDNDTSFEEIAQIIEEKL